MKLGVLSDIHGNHYALEEVLKDAKREKVDRLLILGDIVGYYYYPEIVLKMLVAWDCIYIKGNHEEILENLLNGKARETDVRKKYGSGHLKALEKLSEAQKKMILSAPEKRSLKIDDLSILMCHGSPWKSDFYIYPDAENDVLENLRNYNFNIILIGHSHYAFVNNTGKNLLVNVGSVGQSRTKGGLADWALINTKSGSIQLKSCPYNVDLLINEVERTDPDVDYMKNILLRNR